MCSCLRKLCWFKNYFISGDARLEDSSHLGKLNSFQLISSAPVVTIQWFQQNGMIANPEKYQAVVLSNTAHDFEIKCSEELIPISNEIKLLGVTLDNKLKFDSHIRSICRKVGGQVNALNRLKNILPCKTKEAFFVSCIYSSPLSLLQPDMAPLWGKEY